jgi:hypothetical protein
MFVMEMFEFVKEADCYPNIILFTFPLHQLKKFFKAKIIKELFEIHHVST